MAISLVCCNWVVFYLSNWGCHTLTNTIKVSLSSIDILGCHQNHTPCQWLCMLQTYAQTNSYPKLFQHTTNTTPSSNTNQNHTPTQSLNHNNTFTPNPTIGLQIEKALSISHDTTKDDHGRTMQHINYTIKGSATLTMKTQLIWTTISSGLWMDVTMWSTPNLSKNTTIDPTPPPSYMPSNLSNTNFDMTSKSNNNIKLNSGKNHQYMTIFSFKRGGGQGKHLKSFYMIS